MVDLVRPAKINATATTVGILPWSIDEEGRVHIWLGRESLSDKWAPFEGTPLPHESEIVAAQRECNEESLGLMQLDLSDENYTNRISVYCARYNNRSCNATYLYRVEHTDFASKFERRHTHVTQLQTFLRGLCTLRRHQMLLQIRVISTNGTPPDTMCAEVAVNEMGRHRIRHVTLPYKTFVIDVAHLLAQTILRRLATWLAALGPCVNIRKTGGQLQQVYVNADFLEKNCMYGFSLSELSKSMHDMGKLHESTMRTSTSALISIVLKHAEEWLI
jgi:hypothetical protein